MERYDPEAVKECVAEIAKAAGVPEQDASPLADSLVDVDIYGLFTHGVSRVNIYIRRIQGELIDPKAEISFDKRGSSVIAVDARNGLGQVQACKVLEILIPGETDRFQDGRRVGRRRDQIDVMTADTL